MQIFRLKESYPPPKSVGVQINVGFALENS
jgi:hypothetical protein